MEQKYVFVSGAAGGIGSVTCNYLAGKGFTVFAGDRNDAILQRFDNNRIVPINIDITCIDSIEKCVNLIKSKTSYLNGIVNIAGKFDQFPLMEADNNAFEELINVNLVGQQLITRALFPLLYEAKGKVINLSSETVLALMPLQVYGLSKKLFDVWNTQLHMELNLLGIKVVVVRAGGHQTPFIEQSMHAIRNIDSQSKYVKLQQKALDKANAILSKKQNDALELAQVFYKVLTTKKNKKSYSVNVSLLFRILSWIPTGIREMLITRQLRAWM